jgi:hypothetical protein
LSCEGQCNHERDAASANNGEEDPIHRNQRRCRLSCSWKNRIGALQADYPIQDWSAAEIWFGIKTEKRSANGHIDRMTGKLTLEDSAGMFDAFTTVDAECSASKPLF